MKLRSTLALFFAIALVASSAAAAELSTAQVAERALAAVVVVKVGDALGSGCLVDEYGTVLTCYHVVDGAKSALVKMSNGGYFPTQGLLGMNPDKDVAVLKIDGKQLAWLPLGDSSSLKPGDRVVAIGSPRGLENTVSDGIVSALRVVADCPDELRKWLVDNGRKDDEVLIQFTAPISPGNSGGPLINSGGEIVGIVAMLKPDADNVYFAVPVNEAKPLLANKTVMKFEEVDFTALGGSRKRIGVGPKDLGLGASAEKAFAWTVTKVAEPTYAPLPGLQVDGGTVRVTRKDGKVTMSPVAGPPASGEYRVLGDGSVLFSPKDAKTQMSISLKARSRRVAILPVANMSNLDYMTTTTYDATSALLAEWCFDVIPSAEVGAAVREEQFNVDAVFVSGGQPPSLEAVTKLADRLNASYVVLSGVTASGIVTGYGSSAGVGLALVMYDGRSGKAVLTKVQNVEKDTTWSLSGQRATRQKMVRGIVERVFSDYFGIRK